MSSNGSGAARNATVIVPTLGGERLGRLLASLEGSGAQTIVIDNASPTGIEAICEPYAGVDVVRLEHNAGFVGAINLGALRADGDAIVLLNDDCVCDPGFVERIVAPLDPGAGVVMTAGVMRDWRHRGLIDSAGMELDRTLLVFDYLNGEPLSCLDGEVADPIGPSGAAAAFDRATFVSGRRLRQQAVRLRGGRRPGAPTAAPRLQLQARPRRAGISRALCLVRLGVGAKELPDRVRARLSAAQVGGGQRPSSWPGDDPRAGAVRRTGGDRRQHDRIRGRVRGYREAVETERYPSTVELSPSAGGAISTLRRRARRRARLRSDKPSHPESLHSLAVFHLSETSGPSRSLETELAWLAEQGSLDVAIPGPGVLAEALGGAAEVFALDYEALTLPAPRLRALAEESSTLRHEVRLFRGLIRSRRPGLVLAVTTMLPAVLIAAWLEGVPTLVYCGELFDHGHRRGLLRGFAGRALAGLTARFAGGIIACSATVADQFRASGVEVETVYPPVSERYSAGDGPALRSSSGVPVEAPLLASVGNLTEGRGQDVLVRAMPSILERIPDARCVIAGDPFPRPQDIAFRRRLLDLVDRLGLSDSIVVAGHVEEIADVYAAADVVVNPARFNEPFGRVAFEAAIAGTPAVVTRVGAIPELLVDGTSAVIVPPEDSEALADGVVRVLGDPKLAETLVGGARRVIDDRLTPAHSLTGFQRAVAGVVGESPARQLVRA